VLLSHFTDSIVPPVYESNGEHQYLPGDCSTPIYMPAYIGSLYYCRHCNFMDKYIYLWHGL